MPGNTKVFVSYTATDETIVKQIVQGLREAGFEAWFAPTDLTGGDRLSSIHDQIAASGAFIVVLSRAAANSKWVQHELNTAIALQLDGKPLRVVPVFLEEIPRPPALADFAALHILRDKQDPVPVLVAALKGEILTPDDFMSRFSRYLETLLRIPEKIYGPLTSIEDAAAPRDEGGSSCQVDPSNRQRARAIIVRDLTGEQVSEPDLNRVLCAFDAGLPIPVVAAEKLPEIRTWLRRFGNEEALALAASLWAVRNLHGVTIRWLANDFLRRHRKVTGTTDELESSAETLATRAREAQLLARSTEWNDPRTDAYQDQEVNPSFDIGPMVWQIGRLLANFQRTNEGV